MKLTYHVFVVGCVLACTLSPCVFAYSGGSGTPQAPFRIGSVTDLQTVADSPQDWDKWFVLTQDLELSGVMLTQIGSDATNPFTGRFDGRGHTLNHLSVTVFEGDDRVGLFGTIGPNGLVCGLRLSSVFIRHEGISVSRMGALCGVNEGRIEQCTVTGDIGGSAVSLVGGICGENLGGVISRCSFDGSVSGAYAVGGIAGMSRWRALGQDQWLPGSLRYNAAHGSVSGSSDRVGGLAGFNHSFVLQCYADSSVAGISEIGGLIGYQDLSSVLDCYAAGSVNGFDKVGGLIGLAGLNRAPQVYRCYAVGSVSGSGQTGGLIAASMQSEVVGSFWDWQTTGQSHSAGGQSLSTVQMQTPQTFYDARWDVDSPVWYVAASQYPTVVFNRSDIDWNGRTELADFALLAGSWMDADCDAVSRTDLTGDRAVDGPDLAVLMNRWLTEDVVSDHIFGVEICQVWDYDAPEATDDDTYDIEIAIETDITVVGIAFTTPAGKTFEIPNLLALDDGIDVPGGVLLACKDEFDPSEMTFVWVYEMMCDDPSSLADYGDGWYTFTFTYEDGRTAQTTGWFGVPGTSDPLPQPTQEPVITSFDNGAVLESPIRVDWQPCTDPNADWIWLEAQDQEGSYGSIEVDFPATATGLEEPLSLLSGNWDVYFGFASYYASENSDGIAIDVAKYSKSEYVITVE